MTEKSLQNNKVFIIQMEFKSVSVKHYYNGNNVCITFDTNTDSHDITTRSYNMAHEYESISHAIKARNILNLIYEGCKFTIIRVIFEAISNEDLKIIESHKEQHDEE